MRHRYISCILTLALLGPFLMPSNQRATAQTAPAPAKETTLLITGLKGRVIVRRDERGIPHIEAASEDDLYFAQGYVTAQDRLWQMDLLRRTARGELAEIFGQVVLEDDKRRRTYGFARVAEASWATVSAPARAALEAYARGVNAYIASLDSGEGKKLPVEFALLQYQPRPWTPLDSLVLGKNFAEVLSTTWPIDLLRASLAELPADKREMLLPNSSQFDVIVVGSDSAPRRKAAHQHRPALPASEAARAGLWREMVAAGESVERTRALFGHAAPHLDASNNWVVSGRRTVSGKPLLANDPHLSPSAPSIWHMVHLQAPGLNVAGVTAPGLAGVVIGHNEHITWGMTNLGPDVQDVYLEKFTNQRTYATPAGLREAEVRQEDIKVRKGPTDPATDSVMHEVTVTRHGPVIIDRAGARYALRWTALDPSGNEMDAFYKLNRARDWQEFQGALRDYKGATQNFVYADVQGHIGYYGAGVIPIRQSGDGSTPYDGATDAGEWVGYIPFDKLPHVYDPPAGLIVTANSRVVGTDYPYHLTHNWAAPFRSRRIHDLLLATPKHTADSFRKIQGDTRSLGGQMFARRVVEVAGGLSAQGDDAQARTIEQFRAALKQIETWDGHLNADSPTGPLLAEMLGAFRQRVLNAAIGPERARQYGWDAQGLWIDRLLKERPAGWLPKEFKDYGSLLLACYADAREALTKRIGADDSQWTWGRYIQSRFAHPLAVVPFVGQQFVVPPFPQNGNGSGRPGATVNVGAGVSMRLIADPNDWDRTQHGIALGESGDPKNPHWSDQLADWRAVTPRVFPFSKAAITAAARETLVMTPK